MRDCRDASVSLAPGALGPLPLGRPCVRAHLRDTATHDAHCAVRAQCAPSRKGLTCSARGTRFAPPWHWTLQLRDFESQVRDFGSAANLWRPLLPPARHTHAHTPTVGAPSAPRPAHVSLHCTDE